MHTLSQYLFDHPFFIDHEYEKVGSSQGTYFKRHKYLFSYSPKNGWDLLNFNVLQLFFRKALGVYPSTHLDHIRDRLSHFEELSENEDVLECYTRIKALWANKNIVALGNSPLDNANVICFAEDHTDFLFQNFTTDIINAYYDPGDIILIEGLNRDQSIEPENYRENFKPDWIVRGWEPSNFNELNGGVTKKWNVLVEEYKRVENFPLIQEIKAMLSKKGNLTNEEINLLKGHLKEIIVKIMALNQHYHLKVDTHLHFESQLKSYVLALQEGRLQEKKIKIYEYIQYVLRVCKRSLRVSFYENLENGSKFERRRDWSDLMEGFEQRNASLISEITRFRKALKERKIFVIAGQSHLLESTGLPNCRNVKQDLLRDNFITFVRRSQLDKKLNSDLNQFSINFQNGREYEEMRSSFSSEIYQSSNEE